MDEMNCEPINPTPTRCGFAVLFISVPPTRRGRAGVACDCHGQDPPRVLDRHGGIESLRAAAVALRIQRTRKELRLVTDVQSQPRRGHRYHSRSMGLPVRW